MWPRNINSVVRWLYDGMFCIRKRTMEFSFKMPIISFRIKSPGHVAAHSGALVLTIGKKSSWVRYPVIFIRLASFPWLVIWIYSSHPSKLRPCGFSCRARYLRTGSLLCVVVVWTSCCLSVLNRLYRSSFSSVRYEWRTAIVRLISVSNSPTFRFDWFYLTFSCL